MEEKVAEFYLPSTLPWKTFSFRCSFLAEKEIIYKKNMPDASSTPIGRQAGTNTQHCKCCKSYSYAFFVSSAIV